jgi:uracil-DNA glycosylase family 4
MDCLGANCAQCPFSKNGLPQHKPVKAEQPYKWPPKGLLVGDFPGAEDVEAGVPFSGATGRTLDKELEDVKLYRPQLLVLNAILCQPSSKRDADMRAACKACRPAFKAQLAKLVAEAPNTPVAALGKWASYQLTGKTKGVGSSHGFIDYNYTLKDMP